jgi:hypothetical protein
MPADLKRGRQNELAKIEDGAWKMAKKFHPKKDPA